MRYFLLKVGLFLLPLLALGVAVDVLLRRIPNDYAYKRAYLDAHAGEIETLVLGSSHAFYGVDPAYLEGNAFNAAYVSQSIDIDALIFAKYRARMSRLKTVIVAVSYESLYYQLSAGAGAWRARNYALYYGLDVGTEARRHLEALSFRLPENAGRVVNYHFRHRNYLTSVPLGWGTDHREAGMADLAASGRSAAEHHHHDVNLSAAQQRFRENEVALEKLIAWCAARDVQIVLVTLPAHVSYREHVKADQWTPTEAALHRMAAHYDDCVYVNLLADPRFTDGDFHDGDHLAEVGARKLTGVIRRVIDSVGVGVGDR